MLVVTDVVKCHWLVLVASVNSDADAAAAADDDDNDEILRQVTIRIRVHNFGAQNATG